MEIAAFLPLSLSDHEGHVAAVVFVRGCNFRCPFCHNADLVCPPADAASVPLDEVLARLRDRSGFLDSVVVSGGEPTLQADLASFAVAARSLGLGVKLDTNGSRPDVLARLLGPRVVDSVAMDLKAPWGRYAEYCGVPIDVAAVKESVELLQRTDVDVEFRTTVAPGLREPDLLTIAQGIRGARRYVLQAFRTPAEKQLVNPDWADRPALSRDELLACWDRLAGLVAGGGVRA